MNKRNRLLTFLISGLVVLNLSFASIAYSEAPKDYKVIKSIELVNKPQKYLNTPIKIRAEFDKFTTLGLDYKPAFKDSKKYIGMLIRRPEEGDNVIPLSELKIFLSRDKAEKFIDLESGDVVEITGTEFSTALGDPWVEADNIVVISSKTVKQDKKTVKKNIKTDKHKK